ncbi:hypothetical protein, partial [Porphyromonas loveana]
MVSTTGTAIEDFAPLFE